MSEIQRIYWRYTEVVLFMMVYISFGYLLNLSATNYLLVGIPLSILFQLFIVRKPIHQLWLRKESKFFLNKTGWLIAGCFMVLPSYKLVYSAVDNTITCSSLCYNLATFLGAFAAGNTFSKLTARTIRDFLLCFLFAALMRSALYFLPFIIQNRNVQFDPVEAILALLTYTPVAFVVEEVVFRGMLDTHIHVSKEKVGVWSALFISLLWGLWHLPLSGNIWSVVLGIWGIPLSFFWRRTGNLAVPAFSHAFANSVRDATGS